MNRDAVRGHWNEIRGKLQQQFGKFTNDDVTHMHGTFRELLGELQKKYGYGKEQAEDKLRSFLKENGWSNGEDTFFRRAADDIKEYSSEIRDEIKERSIEARDYVANYVKEKPFVAVGAAVLLGLGLAFILRGRSHHHKEK